MNWAGHQKGEGIEYFVYAVGIALALVVGGGGRYALTKRLCRRDHAEHRGVERERDRGRC